MAGIARYAFGAVARRHHQNLALDRTGRASAAGSRRATSNERDTAVGLIAKRVRSRCLKICRRPRQAGVQDKEQNPGAEHWGIFVVDAAPKRAGPLEQSGGSAPQPFAPPSPMGSNAERTLLIAG